jgi:DNA-binding MarR family transcriptional regulator
MDAYSTGRADMDYSDHPPVIIVASSSAALVRARTSVEACGARIGAALGLSEACDRLRLQPGLRAVWIELDEDCGHEIDELLSLIARDTLNERYGSVVAIAPGLIDPAIAILGDSPVQLLIEPDEVERAAAFALATSQLAIPLRAHDIASDQSAERLRQLSDEVGRIATTLARLSTGPSIPSAPITKAADGQAAAVTADTVRSIIRARRLRARFFREDLFADPAWDMLLDLLQAELSHLRVPVSSLCIAAAVPATTALRWLKTMVQQGLFVRRADPHDGRRVFVELAPEASRALHNYFAEVGAVPGI